MENTIDAPFRRVQNSAASETSFGENASGSEIPREFPVFPCFDCSPAWATFVGPRQYLKSGSQPRNQGLVFPVNFPVFGRRVCTRLHPPPTSLVGASLCARRT